MLTLTILDPACGSGAFLNQALDFLIKEHRYTDELQASLLGGSIVFQNIESTILENNIYGVDLNEESIEIAKLSLWLRTAQPRRQLNVLSNNIKCGNSLIDDKKIAGNKAFYWQEEFPDVFANGGFDVVIGNPPYAGRRSSINEEEKKYVKSYYKSTEGKYELYQLFIEQCLNLVKRLNSYISLITPQTWLTILQATKLRKLVISSKVLSEIVFLGKDVFEDASVDSIVFIITIGKKVTTINFLQSNSLLNLSSEKTEIPFSSIDNTSYVIPLSSDKKTMKIIDRIRKTSIILEDIGSWSDGVKVVGPAKDFAFQYKKFDDTFYPMVVGKNIERYLMNWGGLYCCRKKTEIEKHKATDIRLRDESMFQRKKILIRKTGNEIVATIDEENFYYEQSLFSYGLKSEKFQLIEVLGILNSKFATFLLKENAFSKKDTFPQIRLHWLKEFPIPKKLKEVEFEKSINEIQEIAKTIQNTEKQFMKFFQTQLKLEAISTKLQNWYELEFSEFINELNKAIKKAGGQKLTKMDEMEWMEVFEAKKAEAQALKAEIDKTDKEIDQKVYELYGLSEEEIGIVEDSV